MEKARASCAVALVKTEIRLKESPRVCEGVDNGVQSTFVLPE